MDASIKAENLVFFMRILQCASKYGDDLHIHATQRHWELSVTNSSKSAFCLFKLDKSFFGRWNTRRRKSVKCKLLVKSVLAVLGKAAQVATIVRLDLRIIDPSNELRPLQHRKNGNRDVRSSSVPKGEEDDSDGRHFGDEDEFTDDEDTRLSRESKLIVRLVCKHGVTKKHSLHLGSSDFLRADVDPDTTPSGFNITSRTLRDWLDNFAISTGSYNSSNSGGTDQLGWMFTREEVRMKSWEGMGGGGLCTEIKVDTGEFQDYEVVGDRVDLTLPMKEFRATLVLAEQLSATLNVSFSEPGQPLTLTSLDTEFKDFTIFCAIATTACEAFKDIRSPSIEIKRSSSDGSTRPPSGSLHSHHRPNLSDTTSSSSSAKGNGHGQNGDRSQTSDNNGTSSTPSSRKRKGSEAPSSSRKRSSLNLTPAQEPMSNVYIASIFNQNAAAVPSPVDADSNMVTGMDLDHAPLNDGEALFLPGGTQRSNSPDAPLDNLDGPQPPQKSQAYTMSQADVLEIAGLGDVDLEEALDNADLEDEREMEEEFARASQPQKGQEEEQQPGRHSGSHQSPAEGPASLDEGKGTEMEKDPSNGSKNGSNHPMDVATGSGSGNKSDRSHPAWVTDSISGDTTNDTSNPASALVWDSTIDNPSSVGSTSPNKREASPRKRGSASRSNSPQKQISPRKASKSPSKTQIPSQNKQKEDEIDELEEDDDDLVGHPTQDRPGSAMFKSLFKD
ncbi:uncharacterized protein I206_107420 [Kwoniella pini CBS 10737]|uniref:Cell cycle checkpoint control protein RAD9A n=1 Tax=Kwoniella pini CBS 10737 TaxID=1296096 RepID=A0A1B9HX83_9TREE|nr:uncharacterized protein I206_05746 [Kwoniella pini CBS 10737]OCF47883.1 hypothetical protein I206_05746 [Kwoniella pini CBS 10737]